MSWRDGQQPRRETPHLQPTAHGTADTQPHPRARPDESLEDMERIPRQSARLERIESHQLLARGLFRVLPSDTMGAGDTQRTAATKTMA